mmetsp:Transcript_164920/g.529376  ORF Transcript_164920/g.529376 Transcript_164920/m.529376 type:complete len:245 (-) Transcript_164920:929-1663(-)
MPRTSRRLSRPCAPSASAPPRSVTCSEPWPRCCTWATSSSRCRPPTARAPRSPHGIPAPPASAAAAAAAAPPPPRRPWSWVRGRRWTAWGSCWASAARSCSRRCARGPCRLRGRASFEWRTACPPPCRAEMHWRGTSTMRSSAMSSRRRIAPSASGITHSSVGSSTSSVSSSSRRTPSSSCASTSRTSSCSSSSTPSSSRTRRPCTEPRASRGMSWTSRTTPRSWTSCRRARTAFFRCSTRSAL